MTEPANTQLPVRNRQGAQRRRNVAIALAVGFLCVLFYAVTIVKMSGGFGKML